MTVDRLTRAAEVEDAVSQGSENLGPHLNRVIWVLASLAGLFLALRLYTKLWKGRKLWWDDAFLIASWISLVVSTSLQTVAVSYGLGKHYYDQTIRGKDTVSMFSISAGFASILATTWSKTSFAVTLLRISDRNLKIIVWFVIISVNLIIGSNGVVQWVQCWPVKKMWHALMEEGTCWAPHVVQKYNTFVSAYSGAMDIVLALLPWKIIWSVTINKREKIGALVAMSLGIFAGIMSFLKINTLYVIGNDNETNVELFIFGTAESATSIMAASIPVLRLLFISKTPSSSTPRFLEISEDGGVAMSSFRRSEQKDTIECERSL